ncbi:FHA domain-containing protein [Longibacter salinarum]|nr:FHA domain-containing protein [Longibacter salinarum]
MKNILWMVALLAFALSIPAQAQEQVTIKQIVENPGKYSDQSVSVSGVVDEHVESSSGSNSTMNYMLRGDTGETLRVRTTDAPPAVTAQVQVTGVVSISPFNQSAFIDEDSREVVSGGSAQSSGQGGVSEELKPGIGFWPIFGLTLLGFAIIAVVGYSIYSSSEEKAKKAADEARKRQEEELKRAASGLNSTDFTATEMGDDEGDAEQRIKSSSSSSGSGSGGPATLKFKAPPKTMKFIPGKLVVAAGPDQGKEFRIAGHPTPEGNVVTMGRAEVEGERAFAHIQLGDTYRTVSRMQAEIVQKDQDIYLKNKSTTNPTMVNGEPVEAEKMVELDDGDMIRMGEMMLRYERD